MKKPAAPSKPLGTADILAAEDRPLARVEIPEWGGHVYARTMSAAERDAFAAACEGNAAANIRARLACVTAVDKDGRRLFADGDAEQLGAKSSKAVGRIFDAAAALNGLTDSDVEEISGN